ncbi:MAG: hypothetical protein ABIH82_01820 [Candidatus Woesearchaeota archaeon]
MQDPSRQFSFSDLLKMTKSGPTNVQKSLKELKSLFICKKDGTRTLYQLNSRNYLVKSLFITYAWEKVQFFPAKVVSCLGALVDNSQYAVSIYLFGSAVYSKSPNDFDVAVIYDGNKTKLESIWKDIRTDFQENVEVHFFSKKDFIMMFNEGNYRLTSTLKGCLVLHDRNFIFQYLGKKSQSEPDFLLKEINTLQVKVKKCFTLYRDDKEKCLELQKNIWLDFLRVYIAAKGNIPGSRHQLEKQANKLGLSLMKRDLWESLEWMEKILREIKNI